MLQLYPDDPAERNRWIMNQRGPRAPVRAEEPYAFLLEQERFADGTTGDVVTIFLTNRECPWRCVMCDLWRNTSPEPVKPGDIPGQIEYVLERMPEARQVKLYNSGSFFDPGAIPPQDHREIAGLLRGFERVIVECHPSLVGDACLRFRDLIEGKLEVAMGLETADPLVLEKLNKRMTLAQYAHAAETLRSWDVALRSFVLLQPPFTAAEDAFTWACRSIDFARRCGATAVSLIPTRGGNGAMEVLEQAGQFQAPALPLMESTLEYGLGAGAECRTFVDLWDFERVAHCPSCRGARHARLQRMNLQQTMEARVQCDVCGGAA